MIEIVLLEESHKEEIKEIFFLSSSIQSFSSLDRKTAFFKRWCEDYMIHYPQHFYVMVESDTRKVLGYLSGCDNSIDSLKKLEVPGHHTFQDLFEIYPAHFHINFHPDCRGKGLGSKIVDYYCRALRENNIVGIHLVTSPDSNNVSFYQRLKFTFQVVRVFGKTQQLFMGKKLC